MANKQTIISISREFGSGGHQIATLLAERFSLPLYDRNLLDEIASEKNVNVDNLSKYDEAPKNFFLHRTVRGHSSSPEDNIARMQFDYLLSKANSGESFIVVGRCSETVLREFDGLISIFVLADEDFKLERVMQKYALNRKDAESKIARHDKNRKAYHNHYSNFRWGDSRNYDVCINSTRLPMEETVDILADYIEKRMK